MFARVTTVAFEGIEARAVDVQVQIGPGLPAFTIVGLPDKAVAESRERVRGALNAIGLALPPKRITVNLSPADLPKEGSHYDLPIALGLMAAVGAVAHDAIEGYCVLGELALDGSIANVAGALPAAIGANALGKGLICPQGSGAEAAWAAEGPHQRRLRGKPARGDRRSGLRRTDAVAGGRRGAPSQRPRLSPDPPRRAHPRRP
jgi:magnesium chelatase family protein